MRRWLVALALYLAADPAHATTYYVTQAGSDSNPGTIGSPFQHIGKAESVVVPGDNICVNDNLTYTYASEGSPGGANDHVVYETTSGTSGNPITLMGCNGHIPLINNAGQFYGIRVEGDWRVVGPNIKVYGGADTTDFATCNVGTQPFICEGSGISIYGNHEVITGPNVEVYDEGCSGIASSPNAWDGTKTSDYISILNGVVVHENAFWASAGCSGVSLYELTNADTAAGYHNVISQLFSWGNVEKITEGGSGNILDGNGCIIDDNQHTQHGGLGAAYTSKTLVINSVFAGNGGSGCHVFQSNLVDVVYNTFVSNATVTAAARNCYGSGGADTTCQGQTGVYAGNNVNFYNNIFYDSASVWPLIYDVPTSSNVAANFNVRYGGNGAAYTGANDITTNPLLVNPVGNASGNFHLASTSPAINAAGGGYTTSTDFYGVSRPRGGGYDIGASEFSASLGGGGMVSLFGVVGGLPLTVAYTGPGDLNPGAKAWWGGRAYSSGTRGGNALRACLPGDTSCANIATLTTTGALDEAALTALGCNNSTAICTAKTIYDQTGNGFDETQTTIANRAIIARNCQNGSSCLQPNSATIYSVALGGNVAAPWSVTAGVTSSLNSASYQPILDSACACNGLAFLTSTPALLMFANGSSLSDGTLSLNTGYAIVGVQSGVGSFLNKNGTVTLGTLSGNFTTTAWLMANENSQALTGNFYEAGLWPVAFSSGEATAQISNTRAFWNY